MRVTVGVQTIVEHIKSMQFNSQHQAVNGTARLCPTCSEMTKNTKKVQAYHVHYSSLTHTYAILRHQVD